MLFHIHCLTNYVASQWSPVEDIDVCISYLVIRNTICGNDSISFLRNSRK